jgi:hypothetical protein
LDLASFSHEISQLFEADSGIWSRSHGSERLLIFTKDINAGFRIDAASKKLLYPVSVREGRANCVLSFSDQALKDFFEGKSLAYLESVSQLNYEGDVADVFRACLFLERIISEIRGMKRETSVH